MESSGGDDEKNRTFTLPPREPKKPKKKRDELEPHRRDWLRAKDRFKAQAETHVFHQWERPCGNVYLVKLSEVATTLHQFIR